MEAVIRLGAACVMTAVSAWGGRMLAGTQERRTRMLCSVLTGVKRLDVEMLDRRLPVKEALEACGGPVFRETAREMEGGAPPGEAYIRVQKRLTERGAELDCMEEGDLTALQRLFSSLGGSGIQAQRLLLQEACEELERLSEQARRKKEEHGKLYASLGALAGLTMALLLL